jgi:hypothetical protein
MFRLSKSSARNWFTSFLSDSHVFSFIVHRYRQTFEEKASPVSAIVRIWVMASFSIFEFLQFSVAREQDLYGNAVEFVTLKNSISLTWKYSEPVKTPFLFNLVSLV